ASNNVITGNGDNDIMDGQGGNDTFPQGNAPDGTDQITGGDGVDTVDYSGRSGAVTVTLDNLGDSGESGENDQINTDVENATGGFTGTIGSGTGTLSALFTLAGKSKQNPLKQHNAVLVTVQCKTVPCVVTAGGTLSVPKLAKVYRFKTVSKTLTSTGKTTIKL